MIFYKDLIIELLLIYFLYLLFKYFLIMKMQIDDILSYMEMLNEEKLQSLPR